MTYTQKLLCIPEGWRAVMPGRLLSGWVGAPWLITAQLLASLSALHPHACAPGSPVRAAFPCPPPPPPSWLKTLLRGLRHKGPKRIKLLDLSSFLQWEILEDKNLRRFFSRGSAQLGHLALNKRDVRLKGNCRVGCWTLSSTLPSLLLTKCKELRRCSSSRNGVGLHGSFFSCTLDWMYRGARTALAPHVYSLSLLSLALKMDDFHIIPALATLIWCGFHSFSCKSNHLMDGNVYPPQISTFLPSPPPS